MRHPVSQGRSRKHCNNTAGVFAYIQHLLYADLLKTRSLFCKNMLNVSEYTGFTGHKGNVCIGNTTRDMLKHIPIILLQAYGTFCIDHVFFSNQNQLNSILYTCIKTRGCFSWKNNHESHLLLDKTVHITINSKYKIVTA